VAVFTSELQHSASRGVFLGAAMQIPSLLQIEAECHHGALARRIEPSATIPSATPSNAAKPLALTCIDRHS
jgi:hypothetical protein